jgi:hypothetical protein
MHTLPHRHQTPPNGRVLPAPPRHHTLRQRCHCGARAYWQCDGPPRAADAVRCGRWLCRRHRLYAAAHNYCVWHKTCAEDSEP